MKRICSCFALALGLPLGALNAQEAALAPGTRVRVHAQKHICTSPETWPCYRYVVGTLASIDSAAIVVRLENGETENVSRAPDTRLDAYGGRWHSNAGRGARNGFLIGAAAGAITGLALGDDPPGQLSIPAGAKALGLGLVGGAGGALLGVVIGSFTHHEGWEPVLLGRAVTLAPHGAGLALSLAF